MKLSKSPVFFLICCLLASCSDDSLTINTVSQTSTPPCQDDKCNEKPQQPGTPGSEIQDPVDDPPGGAITPPDTPVESTCDEENLQTDPQNCGVCGHSCGEGTCEDGLCVCSENWFDCNNDGTCETNGPCECAPGDTMPCYYGEEGTAGVGTCKEGHHECIISDDGAYWDLECIGQVIPAQDSSGYICDATDPLRDNDCNGKPDSEQDEDNDGYTICKDGQLNDCCDNEKMCKTSRPDLIHPGVPSDCKGNEIDDNCNGITDEDDIGCDQTVTTCEGGNCETTTCQFDYGDCDVNLSWNNSNNSESALLLARSMDLCMESSSDPTKGSLIEYSLHRSGSKSKVNKAQINILKGMKDANGKKLIKPRIGKSFAMLSTGDARDVYHGVVEDMSFHTGDTVPSVYLKAHKNKLETHPKCEGGDTDINDSVVLHLKLQAPQTAKGFSFDFRFFSHEYPEFLCTPFNDFFLTLLTDEDGKPLVNKDGNISFDKKGNAVSVNNAFFTTCVAPKCTKDKDCRANFDDGCQNKKCGQCDGNKELYAYCEGPYDGVSGDGGGTAWLTTSAPVTGGQIFNLDFYIWDTGDQSYDSSVILDNFHWLCDATLETGFAPPIDNPIN